MNDFGRAGGRRLLITLTEEERLKSQQRHERRLLTSNAKREQRELEAYEHSEDIARTPSIKPIGAK